VGQIDDLHGLFRPVRVARQHGTKFTRLANP
jgi:hypothetical protein